MYFQKQILAYKAWLIALASLIILVPTAISPAVLAQEYKENTILKGDSLWTIAKEFQVTIQEIVKTNNLGIEESSPTGPLLKTPPNKPENLPSQEPDSTLIHTVQKGESLWDIAQHYHLSLEYLSQLNKLQQLDALYIGQEIEIPIYNNIAGEDSGSIDKRTVLTFKEEKASLKEISSSLNLEFRESVQEIDYVVKPGENLWIIAKNYQVSLKELTRANSMENDDRLYIGQIIRIPLRDREGEIKEEKIEKQVQEPEGKWIEHIVVYGENISLIAQKYHLSPETVCELNELTSKDNIYPGQRLKIKACEEIPSEIVLLEKEKQIEKAAPAKDDKVAPAAVDKVETETVYYTVKPGDTLWSIAQELSVSMEGIVAVNYLTNKNVICTGQQLKIPAVGGTSVKKQFTQYTVVKGDSLWSISQKFGVKMHEIINMNELENATNLSVGQKLNLPSSAAAVEQSSPVVSTVAAAAPKTETKDVIHCVQKGETLWQISQRYQVSVQAITNTNQIAQTNRIFIGQRLIIPNARAVPNNSPSFAWPLNGLLTSQFGIRTLGGRRDYHTGIDIGCCTGTAIRAAESGKVSFVGTLSGYGKIIIIDHTGGYSTVYSHNSANLVDKGQTVNKGDIIAKVGATGNATGPHLHFEVRVNGKPDNPLSYLP